MKNEDAVMKQGDHVIVGIHVRNRARRVPGIQKVLTAFGNCIRTRIGLHEVSGNYSSKNGVILIEMVGSKNRITRLCRALSTLEGVEVQTMVFGHD